jgi:hypothetical protein
VVRPLALRRVGPHPGLDRNILAFHLLVDLFSEWLAVAAALAALSPQTPVKDNARLGRPFP